MSNLSAHYFSGLFLVPDTFALLRTSHSDFDGDNQVSLDDLIEAVERVTGIDGNGHIRIDRQSAEHVAQMVSTSSCCDRSMVLNSVEKLTFVHFVYCLVSRVLTSCCQLSCQLNSREDKNVQNSNIIVW